jgi:hypothetical protein
VTPPPRETSRSAAAWRMSCGPTGSARSDTDGAPRTTRRGIGNSSPCWWPTGTRTSTDLTAPTIPGVDRDEFWTIVERARAEVGDTVPAEAYRVDLWAAADLMCGGCSDDGFACFRGWLVAQGRTVRERAVAAPDSLADVGVDPDDDTVECEDSGRPPVMPTPVPPATRRLSVRRCAAKGERSGRGTNAPAGEEFDFEDGDELRVRLPRLAAVCLDD